jgi:hypothetical protein
MVVGAGRRVLNTKEYKERNIHHITMAGPRRQTR